VSAFAVPAPETVSLPIAGSDELFPVRRIYCVGRNYLLHVREMNEGADERDPPFFFQKPRDALVRNGGGVPYPPLTKALHHEVELVVAIGRGGANIPAAQALDHVFGYGVGIDLTRRDLQTIAKDKGWPWEMGKGFDHSAPIGDLARASDVGHKPDRSITLAVNGDIRQNSTINHMTWNVAEVISKLSEHYRLVPGDLILTGTPEGVGALVAGDRLHASIEGLPALEVDIVLGARP
jgi:fumarylpyruvate hydrolase